MSAVPPLAKCVECAKPSWNKSDIAYAQYKWGKYYCAQCSPYNALRPQEEIAKEEEYLANNPLEDIPF